MSICSVKDVSKKEYQHEDSGTWNILVKRGSLGKLCSLRFVDETKS